MQRNFRRQYLFRILICRLFTKQDTRTVLTLYQLQKKKQKYSLFWKANKCQFARWIVLYFGYDIKMTMTTSDDVVAQAPQKIYFFSLSRWLARLCVYKIQLWSSGQWRHNRCSNTLTQSQIEKRNCVCMLWILIAWKPPQNCVATHFLCSEQLTGIEYDKNMPIILCHLNWIRKWMFVWMCWVQRLLVWWANFH